MPKKSCRRRGKQKKAPTTIYMLNHTQKKKKRKANKSITPSKAKKIKEKKLLIGLVKGGKEGSLVIDCNYSSPHYFLSFFPLSIKRRVEIKLKFFFYERIGE